MNQNECGASCVPMKDGILECINRVNANLDTVSENLYNVRSDLEPILTSDDVKTPNCDPECCDSSDRSPIYITLERLADRCAELDRVVQNIGRRINL